MVSITVAPATPIVDIEYSISLLYEGLGFEKIDVRRRYYRNGDDAVIYRLKWAGES